MDALFSLNTETAEEVAAVVEAVGTRMQREQRRKRPKSEQKRRREPSWIARRFLL